MTSASNLDEYKAKRDFRSSSEPKGEQHEKEENDEHRSDHFSFVIQKHNASNLHYDFRLEIDGVYKSWAVPKGPSTDPGQKRLAIPTEDHPLDYGDFEGVIPKDSYGGGTVLIWDRGTYDNLKTNDKGELVPLQSCLKEGHLTIWLNGEKIKGGYALIRTDKGKNERWLLVKMNDDEEDARPNPVSTETLSVSSRRDIEQIIQDEGDD